MSAALRIGRRETARAVRLHGARVALIAGLFGLIGLIGGAASQLAGPSAATASDDQAPPTSADPTTPLEPQAPAPDAGWAPISPDGDVVAFDACAEAIEVVYDADSAPYPAVDDIISTIGLLEEAMDRPITFTGVHSQPARGRPDTITINWVAAPDDLTGADTSTVGQGGPTSIRGHRILNAEVTLIASADLTPGLGPASWGSALLHELGHAVGLGHVQDPNEQMHPTISHTRPAQWGPGDQTGLTQLSPACHR